VPQAKKAAYAHPLPDSLIELDGVGVSWAVEVGSDSLDYWGLEDPQQVDDPQQDVAYSAYRPHHQHHLPKVAYRLVVQAGARSWAFLA
jgi:hypothetical protein